MRWTVPLISTVLFCIAGCANTVPAKSFQDAQAKLLKSEEQVKKLEADLATEQLATKNLQQQIAEVRGIKGDVTEQLIVPVRIELERLSGGYDTDGNVGDDGIVLYIQPFDRDNHVVKAAGTLKITLFDLAAAPNAIAEYNFDVKTTRSLWYGRLMTSHFTAKCPWPKVPPAHNKITARVVFTELLTGRALEAQGVYEIKFPSAGAQTKPH